MADAKRCDRCGAYYEERERNAVEEFAAALREFSKDTAKYNLCKAMTSHVDLCVECEKSLEEWAAAKGW